MPGQGSGQLRIPVRPGPGPSPGPRPGPSPRIRLGRGATEAARHRSCREAGTAQPESSVLLSINQQAKDWTARGSQSSENHKTKAIQNSKDATDGCCIPQRPTTAVRAAWSRHPGPGPPRSQHSVQFRSGVPQPGGGGVPSSGGRVRLLPLPHRALLPPRPPHHPHPGRHSLPSPLPLGCNQRPVWLRGSRLHLVL